MRTTCPDSVTQGPFHSEALGCLTSRGLWNCWGPQSLAHPWLCLCKGVVYKGTDSNCGAKGGGGRAKTCSSMGEDRVAQLRTERPQHGALITCQALAEHFMCTLSFHLPGSSGRQVAQHVLPGSGACARDASSDSMRKCSRRKPQEVREVG